jgi:hypothetical protein
MANGRTAPRCAPPFVDPAGYARHRPEQTLLYQLVGQHYPAFLAAREAAGRPLPKYVQEEFEAYCGAAAEDGGVHCRTYRYAIQYGP